MFLDVNSEAFLVVVDYLNERTISPPDDLPQRPIAGDENQCAIHHTGLTFGRGKDLKVKGLNLTLYSGSYDWGELRDVGNGKVHSIKVMEVFQVSKTLFSPSPLNRSGNPDLDAAGGEFIFEQCQRGIGCKVQNAGGG